MDELFNLVRREADRVRSTLQGPRQGLVSAYDPDNHVVRVMLQPEGVETGWLPILSQHIGNGFGLVIGPSVGDQVSLMPSEGDGETHVVIGRMFSDQDKPPRVESGEAVLRHESGAQIKFAKDKSLTVTDADGASTLHFDGSGNGTLSMKSVKIKSPDIQFTGS